MVKREVEWSTVVTGDKKTWIVIDDRFDGKGTTELYVDNNGAYLTRKTWWKNVKWAPLLLLPVDGRFTPDEYKERAQLICDTLNAQWVKEQLGG